MKKNNLLLSLVFFSFFIFVESVSAEELAKCVYDFSLNTIKGKITCKVEETSVSCSTGDVNLSVDTATVTLTPVNFQSGKTWKCPSYLYYDNGTNGAGGTTKRPALKNLNNVSGSVSATLNSSESSDGASLAEDTPIGDEKSYSCKYGSLVVTYSNNNINISNSTCNSSSSFTASDFASGCPAKVWIYKYRNTCSYSISKGTAGGWVNLNGNDPVLDASGNNVSGEEKTTTTKITSNKTDSEYYTGCPLGKNVTKDIYGLLKILKIVVPILVIGLTILEGVQAVAKGEIAGEEKKLAIRFVKRLIIAVILFFLPVLINQIMIMANIWDENGTCDFSKTSEIIDDSTTTTTRATTTNSSSGGGGAHTSPSGAEHGGGGHRR